MVRGKNKLTHGLKFWSETGIIGQQEMQKRAAADSNAWESFRKTQRNHKNAEYEAFRHWSEGALHKETKKGG